MSFVPRVVVICVEPCEVRSEDDTKISGQRNKGGASPHCTVFTSSLVLLSHLITPHTPHLPSARPTNQYKNGDNYKYIHQLTSFASSVSFL